MRWSAAGRRVTTVLLSAAPYAHLLAKQTFRTAAPTGLPAILPPEAWDTWQIAGLTKEGASVLAEFLQAL